MDHLEQLASAGLTIALSVFMVVTSLLFVDARATKQSITAPKAPRAELATIPRS